MLSLVLLLALPTEAVVSFATAARVEAFECAPSLSKEPSNG